VKFPIGFLVLGFLLPSSFGQQTDAQKRIPPAGIPVPDAIRTQLQQRLQGFQGQIASFEARPQSDLDQLLLPDVKIYEKAVRYSLEHNEFFRTNEFAIASQLIDEGVKRMEALAKGKSPWTDGARMVVRGYKSRIDDSVQPYGLIIPTNYKPGDGKLYRLDIWLHGRDETLSELKFIHDRSSKLGEFQPADTFVLHPYGRYCNAFKFAGETDVMEAIEALHLVGYSIDPSRMVMRGFSMGGAGCWHLAAHYADQWVCASPGAGFVETARYLHLNPDSVPWYEQKLWQWYDATDYALNLFHCPVVAYSGELDKQRQAAEMMGAAMAAEGLPLIHLIGPKTEHRYEPETKKLLATIVDTIARTDKAEFPREIRFTTRTLRYAKMHWLALLGLEKQWERADAWGRIDDPRKVTLSLTNVSSFLLDFQPDPSRKIEEVEVNGSKLSLRPKEATNFLVVTKSNGAWAFSELPLGKKVKQPGLTGPIDDAFTERFIFVTPSKTAFHKETADWIDKELKRAVFEWRAQFRGDVQMVRDVDLKDWQIRQSHLVLWGDPRSNTMLERILPQLPLKWSAEEIRLAKSSVSSREAVPLLIYPNPLNPEKYIVLNSGFTFRGFGSNADQTPKLPDYALLNITKADPFKSGVIAAGFFDEQWEVSP